MSTIHRPALVSAPRPWDAFLPLHRAWWAVFGVPILALLQALVAFLATWPVTLAIGPFGLAVIAMTLLVRCALLPLSVYQVRASLRSRREAQALHRRLAPRVAALRRRYRRRPAELQRALTELLREEGASPLGGIAGGLRAGLLPAVVQTPLLIAFYWAVLGFAHAGGNLHFLWVANLAVPDPLLLPVVAGLTTYLVSRLTTAAQPPSPLTDEQSEAASRALTLLYPLGLAISAHFAPAALVLYWVTGNLLSAAQQWAINRFVMRLASAAG